MKSVKKEDIVKILEYALADSEIIVSELDFSIGLDTQGVDSLDRMNIIFQIQDDYGVQISEESLEADEWLTIDKIVESLNKLLKQQG